MSENELCAPDWLRNLARNYADGVPGMAPEDHQAWPIATEMERLIAENERLRAELATERERIEARVLEERAQAVAVERERCERELEIRASVSSNSGIQEILREAADAIRKGGK